MEKRIPQGKKYISFYISQNIRDNFDYLIEVTELPKTRLYNRAYKHFLEKKDKTIDPRILIRKKTDSQYIKRDVLETDYIKMEYYEELKKIAEEKHCALACVIYAAFLSYISTMPFLIKE